MLSLALISGTQRLYLNLGFSVVTTPTSSSAALKSMFRTEDRHDIASWRETAELASEDDDWTRFWKPEQSELKD